MGIKEIGTEVPPGAVVVHPPHGFVHLVECNANDLMVVNAARVSFRKRSDWANAEELEWCATDDGIDPRLAEADEGVLRFLLRNKHGTPFEQTFFTFHVRAPIFLFREWHRHRIGISINEESGRYVQLQPDFYLPDDEHVRRQTGKSGSYVFKSAGADPFIDKNEILWADDCQGTFGEAIRGEMLRAYREAYESYESMLKLGLAKEIARAVLPVGIYSQMYWSCNARSLMNFLSLRNHERALHELRDYAAAMEAIFAKEMPVTHDEFVKNGRVAP